MKHLAWLAVLAACTDFESIDRDVCGNGLLEPGEDCDSSDPSCVSCAVTCSTAADCPTSDYTCGIDGLCHAPGGAFAQARLVGAFEANDYRITDIDHDGIGDALGVSRSSVVIRYGDSGAPLSTVESQLTPSQTGNAAFGDLDLDGSLDLSIVTPDGLASYASAYGRLSTREVQTELYDPASGEQANLHMMRTIAPLTLLAFGSINNTVIYFVADFLAPPPTGQDSGIPCGLAITEAELESAGVDYYGLARANDETDYLIAMTLGTGPTKRLCVLSIHKDNTLDPPTITDVTPTPNATHKAILADVTNDLDPCPALILTEAAGVGQLKKYDGLRDSVGGHCKFAALKSNLPTNANASPTSRVVGASRLTPRVLGVAPDMVALDNGLYAIGANDWYVAYSATREITAVTHADLDIDGDIDTVLTADGDDIDVLWRIAPGAGHQPFRIDTASEASLPTIDDFDGNGYPDIVYVEPIGPRKRLMVSYGTSDRPLDPVEVGRFADVRMMSALKFPDASDPTGDIADLLVVLPGMPSRLSLFVGSRQRTFVSYFDPRSEDGDRFGLRGGTLFRSAVIGNFDPAGTTDVPDLVGLASLLPGRFVATSGWSNPTAAVRAWSVRGTPGGLDGSTSDGIAIEGVDDCSLPGGSGMCIEDAVHLTWSISASRDVVIAIDRQNRAALFDPRGVMGDKLVATPLTLAAPDGSTVRSLRAANVDGDAELELVAAFSPSSSTSTASAILVCEVSASGVPMDCVDLRDTIGEAAPMTMWCSDAAPGRFGYRDPGSTPTPGSDLLVICRDSGTALHRVYHDGTAFQVETLLRVSGALGSLQVGDVTGDGIDDVVGLEGEAGTRNLIVLPQCSSRDAKTCERLASAEEMP